MTGPDGGGIRSAIVADIPALAFCTGLALTLAALACACLGWWRAELRARAAEAKRTVAEDAHGDLCRAVFAGQGPVTDSRVRMVQLHPGLVVDGLGRTATVVGQLPTARE